MEVLLFSTVSAIGQSLEKKNGYASLEADYKTADLTKLVPELSADGVLDLLIGPTTASRTQFTTESLDEGLIRLSVYEQVHALILSGYSELTGTFARVIGIVGYEDIRGFHLLDGMNARAVFVANLEFKAKQYLENVLEVQPLFKFVLFTAPRTPVLTQKEVVVVEEELPCVMLSAAAEEPSSKQASVPAPVPNPSPKKKAKVVKKKVTTSTPAVAPVLVEVKKEHN